MKFARPQAGEKDAGDAADPRGEKGPELRAAARTPPGAYGARLTAPAYSPCDALYALGIQG